MSDTPTPEQPLSLWRFSAPAWVVARSAEGAIAALTRDLRRPIGEPYDGDDPQRMTAGETFTMWYETPDDLPEGIERDTESPCLGCGYAHAGDDADPGCVTATRSCAEWCAILGDGYVIREFQA